jgi:hypothetical protein
VEEVSRNFSRNFSGAQWRSWTTRRRAGALRVV